MAWNIPEIKKWAKNHKIEVKLDKESKKYRWTIDDKVSELLSIDDLVPQVFNFLTDNKYVQHQEEYRNKKDTKL
jgi:hypothetical protein